MCITLAGAITLVNVQWYQDRAKRKLDLGDKKTECVADMMDDARTMWAHEREDARAMWAHAMRHRASYEKLQVMSRDKGGRVQAHSKNTLRSTDDV